MLKENTTIDYVCRITNLLAKHAGPLSSGEIGQGIDASRSYVCKVLSRMSRAKLLVSSTDGYELSRPISQLTVFDVLMVCHQPLDNDHAQVVTEKLLALSADIPLTDIL